MRQIFIPFPETYPSFMHASPTHERRCRCRLWSETGQYLYLSCRNPLGEERVSTLLSLQGASHLIGQSRSPQDQSPEVTDQRGWVIYSQLQQSVQIPPANNSISQANTQTQSGLVDTNCCQSVHRMLKPCLYCWTSMNMETCGDVEEIVGQEELSGVCVHPNDSQS